MIVRSCGQEDVSHFMELYEHTFVENPHFVRNENFLRYFMQYPGVDKDGVLVAEVKSEIMGLAVVSITQVGGLRQGNIIELLAKDATSLRALIRAVLDYCKRKDVDSIVLVPPPTRVADEILKDWIKFETNVMMTKILSFSSLLQASFSSEKIKEFYAGQKFLFQVGQETVEIKITSKKIDVSGVESRKRDETIWVSMSPQTFLKIIFDQMNPYVAYLTRRVKVQSVKNTRLILKLLRMMQLTKPFYTSLADRL